MTQAEHAAQVEEFMRRRGVTRCPTACVVPTPAPSPIGSRETARLQHGPRSRAPGKAEGLSAAGRRVARFLPPAILRLSPLAEGADSLAASSLFLTAANSAPALAAISAGPFGRM